MNHRALKSFAATVASFAAGTLFAAGVAHAQAADEPEAQSPDSAPADNAGADSAPEDNAEVDAEVELSATSAAVTTNAKAGARESDAADADKGWQIAPYGYARFDTIRDSTQSFNDGLQPFLIARAGTYKGDHPRTILSARDSRVGVAVSAPEFEGMKASGQIEADFYGFVPTEAKEHDTIVFGPLRIRHAFLKLENPVLDVIAGQYYDVFGWGNYFYPGTVAYLGVPGQVYHRNPQFRLEKRLDFGSVELLAAAAMVRAGQRDSGVPDAQGGLKIAFPGWTGAASQGFSRPGISSASLGVSALYRSFEAPVFRAQPGSEKTKASGHGLAANVLIPVIPASSAQDRGNSLTITGEFSTGTGIADMYTGMDGGSRLPLLPNPGKFAPALVYPQNVDNGLVTFDRNFELATVDWQAFVIGLQYYLPIDSGRVWLSGVYSKTKSSNIKDLTPAPNHGGIFTEMEYIDASLSTAVTPNVIFGVSFQTLKQTFADETTPTPVFGQVAPVTGNIGSQVVPGTGGDPITARNNRLQFSTAFFF